MRTAFRFGATEAYAKLVEQRIVLLREARFEGRQLMSESMMRRYEPAMRTVLSTKTRLYELSARTERAANLLRTRVMWKMPSRTNRFWRGWMSGRGYG